MNRVAFQVGEGFLPVLSKAFKDRYGERSRLTLAAADVVTAATAGLLRRSGRLAPDAPVATAGEARAAESLRRLLGAFPEARRVFTDEVSDNEPAGTLEARCDEALGAGTFRCWLDRLEAGDWDGADAVAGPTPPHPGPR